MSAPTRTTALTAAIAITLAGALSAAAQSMPNITAPKTAATNAAAATNAHIQAEQNPSQQSAPPKPATPAPMPRSNPALQGTSAAGQQPAKSAVTPAKGTAAKGAAAKGAAPAPAPAAQTNSVSQRGGKSEIALMRETFAYQAENRRDPFLSLMKTGDLRPMISDLRLVAVIYDPAGRSVAILRDLQTKEQYRVKVGQTLGRMRVNQIRPSQVIFTIEEIGMTRQEALSMNDITKARSQ